MPFYILFAGILFLPFVVVSTLSLLDIDKYRKTIQAGIWTGTALLLAPSYSLPFFFEWGGLVISLICTVIGLYVWITRKEVERQIAIFNVIGTALVTVLLISLVLAVLA